MRTTKCTSWMLQRLFLSTTKRILIALRMPNRSGDVLVTPYGELDKINYFDPWTATVDHVKQVCTIRPANDEELPSPYVEEFRYAMCFLGMSSLCQ